MPTVYREYGQEALDAQYNMRAAIPDYAAYLEKWARWSAAVRERRDCRLDVVYGQAPAQSLDVFPAPSTRAPLQVFIHGGFWQRLDKGDFSYIAEGFVPAGVSVVALNHTLAPAVGLDEIVHECRAALAWLYRHAGVLGADPERLYVSGHSAGGHLAAMLLATDWPALDPTLPADLVKGACAVSGVFDLEPIRLSFLNDVLGMDADTARRNSPLHHLPPPGARLLLAVGDRETDEFRRQTEVYARRCAEHGAAVETVDAPGLHHLSVVELLADPASALARAVHAQTGL